jgi:hypothetical protein
MSSAAAAVSTAVSVAVSTAAIAAVLIAAIAVPATDTRVPGLMSRSIAAE